MMKKQESIGKWVSIMYRYGQSYINKELKEYNLGSGQFTFLINLYKKDGISQEEIADNLNIDKGTTARAIGKLEEEGYVRREKDLKDKRTNKVFLTDKAREVEPKIYKILCEWNSIISNGLSEEEMQISISLLQKMCSNACSHIKGKQAENNISVKVKL